MRSFFKKKFLHKKAASLNAGLTFIELIVVISIFSIIASVVLFNFSTFTSNVTSQNLAQQIALEIKRAQTDALSGAQKKYFFDQAPIYGVYFDISSNAQQMEAGPSDFIIFGDVDGNGLYDKGNGCMDTQNSECISKISINTSDAIVGLCVDGHCDTNNLNINASKDLTILFKRPFPDAMIYGLGNQPRSIGGVVVESVKGTVRLITVNALGQISMIDNPDINGSN